MNGLHNLPDFRREPSGLERVKPRQLPVIATGGTVVPLVFAGATHLFSPPGSEAVLAKHLLTADASAIGAVVTDWAAAFTAALGGCIVLMMQGRRPSPTVPT